MKKIDSPDEKNNNTKYTYGETAAYILSAFNTWYPSIRSWSDSANCQLAFVEALQLVLEHPLAEECKAGGNCDFSMWLISNKSRKETDALSPEKK